MFTRKSHDIGAYNRQIFETTEPGRYFLQPASTYHPDTCFQELPEYHAGSGQYRISDNNNMVNIESDLRNLDRKDSKDPYARYPFVKKDFKVEPRLNTCKIDNRLETSYPLLEAPLFKREQSIAFSRMESEGVPLDPQRLSRIRSNNVIGVNSRLKLRDSFIPTPVKSVANDDFFSFLHKEETPTVYSRFQKTTVKATGCPKLPKKNQCK